MMEVELETLLAQVWVLRLVLELECMLAPSLEILLLV